MKGKRRRTKKKRVSFSKLLLLLESGIVLYTTYEGFALAKFRFYGYAPMDRDDGDGGVGRLRHERRVLLCQGKGGKYGGRRDV